MIGRTLASAVAGPEVSILNNNSSSKSPVHLFANDDSPTRATNLSTPNRLELTRNDAALEDDRGA